MGGLRKYMPITWITSLIGSLALIGTPFFAGFYSKDSIIEAVHHSTLAGSGYAYFAVLIGVFFTALYSFRMYFMVFHGKERMDEHTREHLHETPWVVVIPLIALAIPSIFIGGMYVEQMIFGNFFGDAIVVAQQHDVLAKLHSMDAVSMGLHSIATAPFYLALAGVVLAWFLYMKRPDLPEQIMQKGKLVYDVLVQKYFMDHLYINLIAPLGRRIGGFFWQWGDVKLIDGAIVNGSAGTVGLVAQLLRRLQSGYLYSYAFVMIIGLLILLAVYVFGWV